MDYTQHIVIPKDELEEMEAILLWENGAHPDYGSDQAIKGYSAEFENGFVMDINVCNGDTPYVDIILFAPTTDSTSEATILQEVCVGEVAEDLEGEYHLGFEDDFYTVFVERGPSVEEIEWVCERCKKKAPPKSRLWIRAEKYLDDQVLIRFFCDWDCLHLHLGG